ncbi:diguanylate cyclase [Nitrospirillum viridazoti]|nr:diguanylate cyclase [Nitrospirillum amazonense]TWB37739.1 response regulator receiver modulated diguanylate cyclase [Nitrospirillum amazonense]
MIQDTSPIMPPLPADLLARVEKIRQDFMAGLPDRLAQIRQAAEALEGLDGHDATTARADLARHAHSLAGSGATFGLPDLSVAARALEEVIDQMGAVALPVLRAAIDGLERAITGAAPSAPAVNALPIAPALSSEGTYRSVYLMQADGPGAEDLADILAAYGYKLTAFPDGDALTAAVADAAPEAIILDINPHGMIPSATRMTDARGRKIPSLALSSATGFAARLAAARAGCDAYVVKPPDANALVNHLDRLTERDPDQPLRILIVDDDATLGAYYEMALQSAGMQTRLVTDPLQAVEALYDHNADLMVTDLIMPQCTGFELASVLRQYDGLLALPIVFLTADLDTETHRSAVRTGVDAYLTKPVDLGDLAETVRARARRARQLKALMVRDGLTGAYNHPMIQDLLATEVARAQRDGTDLSFAMLDIDHFKKVNDRYGHGAGDRVIKGLSRLLQQRLRRSDMIGRYGGEEFAVLMPQTRPEHAAERLNLLRQQFSEIPYVHGDTQFQVTFSGGVVGLKPGLDAKALNLTADAALYRAKNAGRNRIELG